MSNKEPPEIPKHRSNKDTKKWCKGKIGVEHQLKCMVFSDLLDKSRALVCTECGKRLAYYFHPLPDSNGNYKEENKPDWVDF